MDWNNFEFSSPNFVHRIVHLFVHQATVIDEYAPPPPDLPIDTIQVIEINQCKVPPIEVTEDRLNSTSG
jgi:hypothetical protein